MKTENNIKPWRVGLLAITLSLMLIAVGFLAYASAFYHADETALEALASDDAVSVVETGYGWLFDGPSDDAALVFYPGAKVEEMSYAPLLRELAAGGLDACLVRVPLRFAFFKPNAAAKVMKEHDYETWYVGGHSLGGVVASCYASGHADEVSGTVLLASYPVTRLPESQIEIMIIGSKDGVINREQMEKSRARAPKHFYEHVIEGGNHSRFGSYGEQNGDGEALIPAGEHVRETVAFILGDLSLISK